MDETQYHSIADAFLAAMLDSIDRQDENGAIDAELSGGVLTIELKSGKQFVVSKHAPSRQIWLSSPISGGLHFSYANNQWQLPDARNLQSVLALEIQQLCGIPLVL